LRPRIPYRIARGMTWLGRGKGGGGDGKPPCWNRRIVTRLRVVGIEAAMGEY
jgi:hypothetical protein